MVNKVSSGQWLGSETEAGLFNIPGQGTKEGQRKEGGGKKEEEGGRREREEKRDLLCPEESQDAMSERCGTENIAAM